MNFGGGWNLPGAVHSLVNAAGNLGRRMGQPQNNNNNGQRRRRRRPQQEQQQQPQQHPQPPQQPRRAPPASMRAIRQIPTIRVAPEDLVEESNRECCICMEDNNLGDHVSRLPCAHIFHTPCLVDWLSNHHCTCPICRFELATDDPMYEAGRLERMKHRKPRFARHELERLPISQLVRLYTNNSRRAPPRSGMDKHELIQCLVEEGRVDLIPSPEPVVYEREILFGMGVGQLKRAMEDAGVFFHPKDVVEKSDMVSIFLNSGRLQLIETEPEESKSQEETVEVAPHPSTPIVETVDDDSDENSCNSSDFSGEPEVLFGGPSSLLNRSEHVERSLSGNKRSSNRISSHSLESQNSREEDTPIPSDSTSAEPNANIPVDVACLDLDSVTDQEEDPLSSMPADSCNMVNETNPVCPVMGTNSVDDTPHDDTNEVNSMQEPNFCDLPAGTSSGVPPSGDSSPASRKTPSGHASNQNGGEPLEHSLHSRNEIGGSAGRKSAPSLDEFDQMTIKDLQDIAQSRGIDTSMCRERHEIVSLISSTDKRGDDLLHISDFDSWSVSELRALALEVKVDLSTCTDRNEMVSKFVHETNVHRPYLRRYIEALTPLSKCSVGELRGIARSRQVNISDCLEKDEIMSRIISKTLRPG